MKFVFINVHAVYPMRDWEKKSAGLIELMETNEDPLS